jgi:hypothetical protein
MKLLHLKIRCCCECPYSKILDNSEAKYACTKVRFLKALTEDQFLNTIPKWCKLKDYEDNTNG